MKVVDQTGGDLSKMLTLVVMALRKSGHNEEAGKIFNMFKVIDKKFASEEPKTASEDVKKKVAAEVTEGGPYKVDMAIVKKHDSLAPYIRLVQKEIKNGGGLVDVRYVNNGMAGIYGHDTYSFFLGTPEVPVEALTKA